MGRNFKNMFPNKSFLFSHTDDGEKKIYLDISIFNRHCEDIPRRPPTDPSNPNMAGSVRVCWVVRNVVGGELFLFLILHSLVISAHCIYLCVCRVYVDNCMTVWQWLVPFTDLGQTWLCWRSVKMSTFGLNHV